MRNSTAYFAGVATVFSATALGFAGAMMLTAARTAPSSTDHAKLERRVASPAQASGSADAKPTTSGNSAEGSNQATTPPPAASVPHQPAQQAATSSPSVQALPSAPPLSETSTQPPVTAAEQTAEPAHVKSTANAYALGSDGDIRKYIRKRERHWARRHYLDDDTASDAQDAKSGGQNTQSQPSASESQSSAQGQTQPTQIKAADQASAKVDDSDAVKVKRKHDRRWTRGYARDHNERGRDDDRARSFEVREVPGEDAPQAPFSMPRWRPLFSDGDDD
jgi:hypothetical protein